MAQAASAGMTGRTFQAFETPASTSVAEVRISQSQPIAPELVQLPGVYVDYVVAVGTNV